MKRISQLDTDLDKAQEQLSEANTKLEDAAKKSADVSVTITHLVIWLIVAGPFRKRRQASESIFACMFPSQFDLSAD